MLWNAIALLAVGGIIYGTIETVQQFDSVWKALLISGLSVACGVLAVEILYPLWYGDK